MHHEARYQVVSESKDPADPLIIKDVGPWDRYMTITNAAVTVVQELRRANLLPDGRRLLYVDSQGRLDEIIVKDGHFAGFACLV